MTGTDPVRDKARRARAASLTLQASSHEERVAAVCAMADALWDHRDRIADANQKDVQAARADGIDQPLVDRLHLGEDKLATLLDGVRQVAEMADPIGQTLRATELDDGLDLYQVRVPIGVIGVVFESRPDALVQIAALTIKSGNAALLKGGREAERTNQALCEIIRTAIEPTGVPADAVQTLAGRAEVTALLDQERYVDLIIPRGSSAFVRHIMDHTRIPVMGHAEGVCHVYVDAEADLGMALDITIDAKTDYPAACNAAEAVLVHQAVAEEFVGRLRERAEAADVRIVEGEDRYGVEFGDRTLALRVVPDLDAAIGHVNRYGSKHTDTIVTRDSTNARRFVAGVDAASVFVNASTRFADGYRYGLGAEVGISTGKLHARGPVGVEGVTSTKWVLLGQGQTAGAFQGPSRRTFTHRPLDRSLDEAMP